MRTDRGRRLAAVSALAAGGVLALSALVGLNLLVWHLLTTDRCSLGGCTAAARIVGDRPVFGASGAASVLGLLGDGRVVVLTGVVAAGLTAAGWWFAHRARAPGSGAADGDALADATTWLRLPATLFVATYVAAAAAIWPAIRWIGNLSG